MKNKTLKNLEKYKQLCCIIAEEINVKNVSFHCGKSEKGDVNLIYSLEEDSFYWLVGKERRNIIKQESVVTLMEDVFLNWCKK